MSRRHYRLPPLTALATFETAARHLSFKDAAQELSVTPGAVSHQVKALEGDLGVALFHRQHRGVALTVDGQALFETLASSFGRVSKRLKAIRVKGETDKITVGSTTAVAALWLSPAIVAFWRRYPEVNVDQLTQDAPFSPHTELDFVVRYGRDPNNSLPQTALYRDDLVVVGTPEQAAEMQNVTLDQLAEHWLIHLESDGRDWTTWGDWFHQLGHDGLISKGTRVTNYSVALQLASQGAGLALGWRHLIQPMLERRELAIVGRHRLTAPRAFYLVDYTDGQPSHSATSFRRWILNSVPDKSVEFESRVGEVFCYCEGALVSSKYRRGCLVIGESHD